MATMNYPHPPQDIQPGERLLFNRLKKYLPHNYFVWYEPTIQGRHRSVRPDFIVLGNDLGIAVIEVKDWSVDRIVAASRDSFTIELQNGQKVTRSNPAQQAQRYVFDTIREIKTFATQHPNKGSLLLQKAGRYKGNLAFPVYYLVAFPNISRSEWEQSDLQLNRMIHPEQVLFKEDLGTKLLPRLQSARLFYPTSMGLEQIAILRWVLNPEIRLPIQRALFTLDYEQEGLAKLDTYLSPEGLQLTQKMNVKLVRGVVGSGKTLILLFRAKFISEQNSDWRILILTYNKSLRDYLVHLFKKIGGDPQRVEIVNFHKWMYHVLADHKLLTPPLSEREQVGLIANLLRSEREFPFDAQFLAEEFNWIKERIDYRRWDDYLDPQKVRRIGRGRRLGGDESEKRRVIYDLFLRYQERLRQLKKSDWPQLTVDLLRAIHEGKISKAKYHAILIDEAQDFAPSWFRAAFAMLRPETKMVFIVGDGAQRIYRRDFTWKELGIGIGAHNSHVLTHSYRNTYEIIEAALQVIKESPAITQELADAGDYLPEKQASELSHGPSPFILPFKDRNVEYKTVAQEIQKLLRNGYRPQDIAILQRYRKYSKQLANELSKQGLAYQIIRPNNGIRLNSPSVKIMTLHSAKGLEFKVVFICGLEDLALNGAKGNEFQEKLDQERKLLYVGMTRAKDLLYITYTGVAPEWIVSRLTQNG